MNKLIPLSLMGVMIIKILAPIDIHSAEHQKMTIESKKVMTVKSKENAQPSVEQEENTEEMHNEIGNTVQNSYEVHNEIENIVQNSYETRMTSYYPNDGPGTGSITGSGLGPNDFEINEHGWYTYQGKLVVATATPYLEKYGWVIYDGVHTFKYYDEVILNIDGIDYESIVVDSCGNCCKTDRIDLFVSNKESVKDTNITVKMK